jgi:hypothetical protein
VRPAHELVADEADVVRHIYVSRNFYLERYKETYVIATGGIQIRIKR